MQKALALLTDDLIAVEAQFKEDLTSEVPLIRKVGEYVLASGGKRFRPMLLLLSARLCGYVGKQHVALASVVEFIHTATLLHDDVVDSAVLRRGNTSANAVWGNEASVLVGDFLFAKSFSLMVAGGDLEVLRILSHATTMMAEGEVQQLLNTCDITLDEERYMSVVRTKTAVLIAAACQCGAIISKVDKAQEEALSEFGIKLGMAFQFMDDALDYVADEAEFGKAHGHDLSEGKVTLPLIHALQHCTADEHGRIETILEADEPSNEDIDFVCGLIARTGGIDYTRQRALELVEEGKASLASFPEGEAKEALKELADYVVSRRH